MRAGPLDCTLQPLRPLPGSPALVTDSRKWEETYFAFLQRKIAFSKQEGNFTGSWP